MKGGIGLKVKVLSTGKIVTAKRFKDLSENERKESVYNSNRLSGEEIFIKPLKGCKVWRYVFDSEVKIIKP
jgi:hypothetical protein